MKDISSIRHSLAHILAQAVKRIYGDSVKLGMGPSIEDGFFYDFDFGNSEMKESDLPKIEAMMKTIMKEKQVFHRTIFSKENTYHMQFLENEPYKKELFEEMQKENKEIIFYENRKGDVIVFLDMCEGPHVDTTQDIDLDAFCLDRIAGAYWKGDQSQKMLTRIYGLAFESAEKLREYIRNREEAKKRDHRIIGEKLGIFSFSEHVGLGLPLWHPMGGRIWRALEDFWLEEHKKAGYEFVRTPHIGNKMLWEISGHWGFYSESMYPPLEVGQSLESSLHGEVLKEEKSEKYLLKPMNCPFHMEIYLHSLKSYRDFPVKYAEIGTVYRFEKSGQLSGLTRVRGFTQDDAHIFCRKDQVEQEIENVVDFIEKILGIFQLSYEVYLSFREKGSKKYVGEDDMWDFSESVLHSVVKKKQLPFKIEPGEAAFYGPKIDFRLRDCLGRTHQCSTVQFDFNLPHRFQLSFTNASGQKEVPFVIHRALFGSFERFISILIEHFGGYFPLWIAPRQVVVVPVCDKYEAYGREVYDVLKASGLYVEFDDSSHSFSKKIRNAEVLKVNYICIVGEEEVRTNTVTLRDTKRKKQLQLGIESARNMLLDEIEKKAL